MVLIFLLGGIQTPLPDNKHKGWLLASVLASLCNPLSATLSVSLSLHPSLCILLSVSLYMQPFFCIPLSESFSMKSSLRIPLSAAPLLVVLCSHVG